MNPKRNRKNLGNAGEEKAVAFLEDEGFTVLKRNFRFGKRGEIDIIALKENLLIFVEVKLRRGKTYGGALYSISKSKIKRLKRVAEYFLDSNREYLAREIICRFDLIALENDEMLWHRDIFR